MDTNIQLVGISGSLRTGSYNTMLLHAVKELLPDGMTLEIVSFKDLPVYNADQDLPAAGERPQPVVLFRKALAKAEGFVIVSPEYNYSIPGGLKNAIDWASRGKDSPITNKPIALMGATPGLWGTQRGQNAFHPIFQALNATTVRNPEVFVNKAAEKFNEAGQLTDEQTKDIVRKQLAGLKDLIERVKK